MICTTSPRFQPWPTHVRLHAACITNQSSTTGIRDKLIIVYVDMYFVWLKSTTVLSEFVMCSHFCVWSNNKYYCHLPDVMSVECSMFSFMSHNSLSCSSQTQHTAEGKTYWPFRQIDCLFRSFRRRLRRVTCDVVPNKYKQSEPTTTAVQ